VVGANVSYFDATLTSTKTVEMRVVDAADNHGPLSAQLVTIDATAPTTTVIINGITDDTGTYGNFVTNDNNGLLIDGILSDPLASDERLMYSTDGGATWLDITSSVIWINVSYFDASLTSTTTVQMKVVDAADNNGAVASQLITIDTTPPTITVNIDSITDDSGTVGDFTTIDNNGLTVGATLSATLASDDKLLYSTDGGATWLDITSSVLGTSVSYHDLLLTSTATVEMKVVDEAGNNGAVDAQLVTIDTTAPTTTIDINSITDDSGIAGDFTTNDNNGLIVCATLSAGLDVGEKLLYSTNSGVTWIDISSSVVGVNVSYTDATLTSTSIVDMKVVDAADNDGAVASKLVTIDTTAPTTTVIINGIADDSGVIGDFTTNDNDGLAVSGGLSAPLESGEKLYYSNDNGATWIDITGSAVNGRTIVYIDNSLTSTATVQMKVVDEADNDGGATSQLITIDTTPPATAVNIDSIITDSGIVGDFITNDNDGLTVDATLSASLASGDKLLYSTDSGVTWTDITSSVSGTTVSYADASLTSTATVQMKVVDAVGNDGAIDAQLVTITVAGPATTVDINSITDDSGVVGDFVTRDNDGLTVGATLSTSLAVGEKLMYSSDGGASWTDISGSVSGTTVSYADVTLTSTSIVGMKVVDVANNDGAVASRLITIDTTAPTTTAAFCCITTDSGTLGDYTTNDNDGLIVGANLSADLAEGEKLYYSNDNGATWIDITSSVTGRTVVCIDNSLNSTTTVQMKVVDAADNDGAIASQLITIDTTLPTTTVNIDSIADDTGTLGDFITSDDDGLTVDATLSTSLAAGEKLLYSTDGGATWLDITSSVLGTAVSYHDPLLTSTATVEMKVVDVADNDGAVDAQLVTIDTIHPTTTIDINNITDDSGVVGDFITNDNNGLTVGATLSAGLDVGEKLLYSTDSGVTWTDITSSVSGTTVSYTDATLTSTSIVDMKIVDVANNDGAVASKLITIDTTPPTTTVDINHIVNDSGITHDFTTNDNDGLAVEATLSASLVNGEKLYYSNDNGATWIDITSSVNVTTVNYYDATLTSTTTVKMKVVDEAGNDGVVDTQLITIDTTPPATTVSINSITDDSGTVGDFITSDNDGLTVGATLSTGLVSGEKLMYSTDGGATWTDITSFVGGTSVSYHDLNLSTTKTVEMKVVDAADNDGAVASQLVVITNDTTPPQTAASVVIVLDTNNDDTISPSEKGAATTTNINVGIPSDAQIGDVITVTNNLTGMVIATFTVDGTTVVAGTTKVITGVALPTATEVLKITTAIRDAVGNIGPSASDKAIINEVPIVSADNDALFGLVGAEALGLFDYSNQAVFAMDPNNNIQTVVVRYTSSVNISTYQLTASSAMAAELGLNITIVNNTGTLSSSTITITAVGGGAIDNQKLNELLTTIRFANSGLVVAPSDTLTITATDTNGLSSSDSANNSSNISLLHTQSLDSGIKEGTVASGTMTGTVEADRLYGYGGNDKMSGLEGNDLLRGGDGRDTLNGGDGNDILIGDQKIDILNGGAGDDKIEYDNFDAVINGGIGLDTLYIAGGGITLDITHNNSSKITGVEKIDLTGTGNNALILDYNDMLALSNTGDVLYVTGNGGDTVTLTGEIFMGSQTVNGIIYNTYNIGGTSSPDIWVQEAVRVI
ncbi:MAG: hypothetical protein WC253_08710, partial [Sulfurovaceae bacterium]